MKQQDSEIVAARKSLVADRLLRDSGKTQNGQIVWEPVPYDEMSAEARKLWHQMIGDKYD